MNFNSLTKQQAFTLVEMMVVMLIAVALASVTLDFTKDFSFQGRYEVTKDRYEKIKRAIIGRPDVLINGQPDISGFVADMGRLPRNIRELLDQDYCTPDRSLDNDVFDSGSYGSAQTECNTSYGAGSWLDQGSNWKGPYLSITKGITDSKAFSDGWGNQPTDYCSDFNFTTQAACTGAGKIWITELQNHNYGWNVKFWDISNAETTTEADYAHMIIQSKGKDQAIGGTENSFDADYPNNQPAIRQNDWQVDLNGFPLRILASSVAGTCSTPTPTDPATCALVGGSWTGSCTSPNITLENDCILLDGTWDSVSTTCSAYSISSAAACTQLSGTWSGSGSCLNPITPSTKLACLSAGETWTSNLTNNLCLKIINHTYTSYDSSVSQSVSENGTSQIVQFPYTSPTYVTPGESTGILFTDNACSGSNTYPSSHTNNICIDSNDDTDFISTNCEIEGGIFINDGTENYCRGVTGVACTGNTGTNLGGTEHPSVSVMLIPNSILPTVTW